MHTCIRTYVHTTCMHTYLTCIHTCMHAYMSTYVRACMLTYTHTHVFPYIYTDIDAQNVRLPTTRYISYFAAAGSSMGTRLGALYGGILAPLGRPGIQPPVTWDDLGKFTRAAVILFCTPLTFPKSFHIVRQTSDSGQVGTTLCRHVAAGDGPLWR